MSSFKYMIYNKTHSIGRYVCSMIWKFRVLHDISERYREFQQQNFLNDTPLASF